MHECMKVIWAYEQVISKKIVMTIKVQSPHTKSQQPLFTSGASVPTCNSGTPSTSGGH